MNATLARMAKPKKDPTDNVRMAKVLAKHARMVAAAMDISLPDYLTKRLAPLVEEDLRVLCSEFYNGSNGPKRKSRSKDSPSAD